MRSMYDCVNPQSVPTTGDMYAGYVDGLYQSWKPLRGRFPGKIVLQIAVYATTTGANVYDVETGDLTYQEVVPVLIRERRVGNWPSVYCNLSNQSSIQNAVAQAGLAMPPFWVAHWTEQPHLEDGSIATQWSSQPGYDVSEVADYWPGVDLNPSKESPVMLTPAAQVRAWCIEHWGREPSVLEQYYGEVEYSKPNGDDLTLASIYDNPVGQAFRLKRGW